MQVHANEKKRFWVFICPHWSQTTRFINEDPNLRYCVNGTKIVHHVCTWRPPIYQLSMSSILLIMTIRETQWANSYECGSTQSVFEMFFAYIISYLSTLWLVFQLSIHIYWVLSYSFKFIACYKFFLLTHTWILCISIEHICICSISSMHTRILNNQNVHARIFLKCSFELICNLNCLQQRFHCLKSSYTHIEFLKCNLTFVRPRKFLNQASLLSNLCPVGKNILWIKKNQSTLIAYFKKLNKNYILITKCIEY